MILHKHENINRRDNKKGKSQFEYKSYRMGGYDY